MIHSDKNTSRYRLDEQTCCNLHATYTFIHMYTENTPYLQRVKNVLRLKDPIILENIPGFGFPFGTT